MNLGQCFIVCVCVQNRLVCVGLGSDATMHRFPGYQAIFKHPELVDDFICGQAAVGTLQLRTAAMNRLKDLAQAEGPGA